MTRHILYTFLAGGMLLGAFSACQKQNVNTYYKNGTTPVLSSSVTTIATPVSDSNATAVVFSWTDAKYPTPAPGATLYTLQIDSAGHNFGNYQSLQVSGALADSLSAKLVNTMVLALGAQVNTPYTIEVRVVSSYANNNDQLNSNVVNITVTPYQTPPKVTVPPFGNLYIVGSATACAMDAMVDTSIQKFTKVDSVDYQGTFYLAGSGGYYFVPVNGTNAIKYNLVDSTNGPTSQGGAFQVTTSAGEMIPAPSLPGLYQIKISFQTGYYSVTPVNTWSAWYLPGNYQGWTPATAPTVAAINNDGNYEGYANLVDNQGFKITAVPNWNGTIYGDANQNGNSGVLTTSGGGNNIIIPAAGYYFVQIDSSKLTYTTTQITEFSLIGAFNNWSADVPMTYNAATQEWTGTFTAAAAGSMKIRSNLNWSTPNYGTGGQGGSMINGGGNINYTAGTHNVIFRLNNPGYYTITIQ